MPLNHPPSIVYGGSSSSADARSVLQIDTNDIDGDAVSLAVAQLAGPAVTISVSGSHATITFPDVPEVEDVQLAVQARDSVGAEVSDQPTLHVYPLSPSGKLHTILGGPALPGMHLIITGDGYTSTQQGLLVSDTVALATQVFDTPDIQPYKVAWNVHVLEAVSNESGVSLPLQMIQRDTVFNGALGCFDIVRLLCLNFAKVQMAAAEEFPGSSMVIVISNTDLYGGSGGQVVGVTRNPNAPLIALHELGHAFAHLADEYVDGTVDVTVPFSESRFPNVTQVTDLTAVKWKYWFDLSAPIPTASGQPGVGLFEGAFYQPTGYYRPTDDSFMRTLSQNMGPVNTEAWILSVYGATGAVQSATPTDPELTTASGVPVTLSVVPTFPAGLQRLQWFVDGSEVMQARDMTQFSCCGEGPSPHLVLARVLDVSGKVLTPQPGPALYEKTWTVQVR
jgi:hypothetical protein